MLLVVVDSNRPWMMLLRVVGWRWQALRRVGVMLGRARKSATRCVPTPTTMIEVRMDGNNEQEIRQGMIGMTSSSSGGDVVRGGMCAATVRVIRLGDDGGVAGSLSRVQDTRR